MLEQRTALTLKEDSKHPNVWLEPPSDDPAVIAEGQALARAIQSELAALAQTQTLEETMQVLRGCSCFSQ